MDWQLFVPGVVVLIAAIVLRPFFSRALKRTQDRLDGWAKSEGVTIVSRRHARFYEGSGAWLRSEDHTLYRLEVRDRQGRVRLAWVTIGDEKQMFESNPDISNVTWG